MNKVWMLAATALLSAAVTTAPANAAGCLKGAAVGGVAGHYAGNHGLVGVGVGCVVGRHQANKREKEKMNNTAGYGSSSNTNQTR
jgi:predicted transcriptional regulator with HTH domain